jgi:hypothetical protein
MLKQTSSIACCLESLTARSFQHQSRYPHVHIIRFIPEGPHSLRIAASRILYDGQSRTRTRKTLALMASLGSATYSLTRISFTRMPCIARSNLSDCATDTWLKVSIPTTTGDKYRCSYDGATHCVKCNQRIIQKCFDVRLMCLRKPVSYFTRRSCSITYHVYVYKTN